MITCEYCGRFCAATCTGAKEERLKERISRSRRWFVFGGAAVAVAAKLPAVAQSAAPARVAGDIAVVSGYGTGPMLVTTAGLYFATINQAMDHLAKNNVRDAVYCLPGHKETVTEPVRLVAQCESLSGATVEGSVSPLMTVEPRQEDDGSVWIVSNRFTATGPGVTGIVIADPNRDAVTDRDLG